MAKVKVTKPFTSDGRCYNIGQTVEVEDGFALDLIAAGMAKEEAAPKVQKKAVKKNEGK